jgi:hypothetical protein
MIIKIGRYITHTELFTVVKKANNKQKYNYSPIFNLSKVFNKFSTVISSTLVTLIAHIA